MSKQLGILLVTICVAILGLTATGAYHPTNIQTPRGSSSASSASYARIQKIEKGIEPVEVSNGAATIPLDVESLMKTFHVPGMSVALIDNYQIAWTKTYGVIAPGSSTAVTNRTLFQAGSISKPVAATGMMVLVQNGELSLDEDVNTKLKTWKVPENEFTKNQKVTLRRLASHSAGLTVHGFPGYDIDEKIPTLVEVLNGEKPANTAPVRVDFVPGTDERYSGGGITIEQLLMMDVSGQQFPALMKASVLDKIGMADSSYEQPLPAARAAMTAGGDNGDGKPVHGKWHIYPEMAAAGLWTTPTDLAKFVIEIALSKQGKSNKILSQKSVQEMLTPQSKDFGIGFALDAKRPGEFGHDGADDGFQAVVVMNADTGQGAAIMADSNNGITVAYEYLRSLAKEYAWKYPRNPRSAGMQIELLAQLKGLDAALARYDELKKSPDPKNRPEESLLNEVGYGYFRFGQFDESIRVFQKNVQEYPQSSNVYDSLGEAYAAAGKKDLAIANYEKSIELNPKNENGIQRLKKLKEQP